MADSKVTRQEGEERMNAKTVIGARRGLIAWGELVAQRASLRAPVATGELARSVHAGETFVYGGRFGAIGIRVGTNLEYARAQELGSGLHDPDLPGKIPIMPVHAKALAFEWPGAPAEVEHMRDPESGLFFFQGVMHPGVAAQPYLLPAHRESKMDGRRLMISAFAAEMKRVGPSSNAPAVKRS